MKSNWTTLLLILAAVCGVDRGQTTGFTGIDCAAFNCGCDGCAAVTPEVPA